MKKYNISKSIKSRFLADKNPEPEPSPEAFGISVESPFGVPDPILKKLLGERLRILENRAWGAVPAPDAGIFNGLEDEFPNFADVIGMIRTFSVASRLRPELPLR